MQTERWTVIARVAAVIVAVTGATVLVAWAVDFRPLQAVVPGLSTMKANTASGFLLSGISLWFLSFGQTPASERLARIGATLVSLFAALTLLQYLFQWDFGIDEILFVDERTRSAGGAAPGRMSIATATSFLLSGLALIFLCTKTGRARLLAQSLAIVVALSSYLALLGYLFGVESLIRMGPYSTMAAHTALAFFILSGGLLAARPDSGFVAIVSNRKAGGLMARQLLPAAILLPPALGWLRTLGQGAGWYDAQFGRALLVSSLAIVFSILIWRSAALLNRIDARREASERAAREGNLLLQSIIDNTPAVVYAKDLTGRYLLANRRFDELMNIEKGRIIGKTDFDLFAEAEAAAFRDMDVRVAAGGVALTEEEVLPQPDGPQTYISVKCPLRDADGNIQGIFGVSTDITQRKRADTERNQLLARERLARAEAEAQYGVAKALASERDVEQVMQQVTDAATRLTGAQFGAFLQNLVDDKGESYVVYKLSGAPREAFDKFGLPRNTALFETTFRGAGPVRIADVVKDSRYGRSAPHHGLPKGHPSVRSYLAVPVISRSGQVLGGLFFGHPNPGVFDERSERIALGIAAQAAVAVDNARLHQDMKASAARLEAQIGQLRLLDQITRAIDQRQDLGSIFQVVIRTLEDQLAVDFGCLCRYDAASAVLEISHIGIKGRETAQGLGLAEHSKIEIDENGLSRCVRGQFVYEPEVNRLPFDFPRKLAEVGLLSVVFSPVILESRVFGVLIIARRETHSFTSMECEFLRQLCDHVALAANQVQLYGSLQQAYDELRQSQQSVLQQERLRSLGQMASGIAHDINNAISPASLYTESLLMHEDGLSARGRDQLLIIQRAVEDVAETVARMRAFYRPREAQLALAPVDLNGILREIIELTRPRWSDMPQERGIVIRLETDFAVNLPYVMGAQTEIRDGLTNLILNAVDAMPEGGTLSLATRGENSVNGLRNSSGEHQHRAVIEVKDTGIGMDEDTRRRCLEPFFTTKGEQGTGLGLATVYGMVQRHGADLEIDSMPGIGTTVRLVFPGLTAGVDTTAQQPVAIVERRLRVLLIDDDPVLLHSLADVLASDGHQVALADGGQAGIQLFHAARERGNAFEAVITDLGMPHIDGRRVAAEIRNISPTTPVIMLTGWGQRLAEENGIPEHVDQVLSKPPKLHELRAALNRAATRSSMPGTSSVRT